MPLKRLWRVDWRTDGRMDWPKIGLHSLVARDQKQGQIHIFRSRIWVGRDNDKEGHWDIWSGAVSLKMLISEKGTNQPRDGRTKQAVEWIYEQACTKVSELEINRTKIQVVTAFFGGAKLQSHETLCPSVGWYVGRLVRQLVGWSVGNAFVWWSTLRSLLAYLSLFFLFMLLKWKF